LKDFTEKTQINTNLIEMGKEQQSLHHYFGLSIMRIIKHLLFILEKQGYTSQIDVKIRWRKSHLYLSIKANRSRKGITLKANAVRFIDERVNLLGGRCKFSNRNLNKLECLIALPLYISKGEPYESQT
jgi:glucose-6-phosphate-specific signal transduction histidine kinase